MVAIGNHEFDYVGQEFNPIWANYSYDSRGECGVPFESRFIMPQNGNGDLWFSIDYPLLHVVVISTEHDFTEGSEQLQWIEQDLASVNRSEKWIILTGHRPMYEFLTTSLTSKGTLATGLLKTGALVRK
jgi:hypothetical protein